MALPTNTFATYEAIGNREDLSDVIYRIDPTDTPFMSGVRAREGVRRQSRMADAGARGGRQHQRPARRRRPYHQRHHRDGAARQHLPDQLARSPASPARSAPSITPAATTSSPTRRCSRVSSSSATWRRSLCGTNQAKNTGNDTTARKTASRALVDQVEHVEGHGRRRRRSGCRRRRRHPHRRHAARLHRGATSRPCCNRSGPTAASPT